MEANGEVPETRYARSGDLHVAYQVVGEGPIDLLFFSEWWFNIDIQWEDVLLRRCLRRLASFSRLILFDTRGFGLSDPLPSDGLPSLEDTVADVLAVLEASQAGEVAILATGDATPAAVLFTATHPQRVRALAICNGFARYAAAPDYPIGMSEAVKEGILQEARERWGTPHDVPLIAPSLTADPTYQEFFARAARQSISRGAAIALTRFNFEMDVRPILPAISAPTMVFHRRGDRYVPASQGRYLAEHIQGARFVDLPGEDHLWWAGATADLLESLEEFFTGAPPTATTDRVLSTVLFTDIAESTSTAAAVGDQRWRDLLDSHDLITRRQLERFRGREIKTLGDGVLALFDAPGRAIRCAEAILASMRPLGLSLRAGIHTGEVELRAGDVGGLAVHIAARVLGEAGPGEVLVSSSVPPLVSGSGIDFEDRGEHQLKGIPGTWRLFALST